MKNVFITLSIIIIPLLLNFGFLSFTRTLDVNSIIFIDKYNYYIRIHFDKPNIPSDVTYNYRSYGESSYIINFYSNTCSKLSYDEGSNIFQTIRQSGLSPAKLFPGYAVSFFKIKLNYSDSKVTEFVKEKCNLSPEYPYTIKFDHEQKYY